jgi:hypothetical protein
MIEQVRSSGKFLSCALEVSGSSLGHDCTLRFSVVILSASRQWPGQRRKLGHGPFLHADL